MVKQKFKFERNGAPMAKTVIKKVSKTPEWAKNVLGITDKDVEKNKKQGFGVLYVYSVYPYGGGDDKIEGRFFNKPVLEQDLSKFFSNSKIKGQLFGEICEIIF